MRRKNEEGDWIFLRRPNLEYLGIFDERTEIKNIEIIGTYFNRLPSEIDEIFTNAISCNANTKIPEPILKYKTYSFSPEKGLDEIKPKGYGEKIKFKPQLSGPCKTIIITAENIDSTNVNLRSNYTTNPVNVRTGMSPIGDIIVKNKFKKDKVIYTSNTRRRYMQMFLPRMPVLKGHEFIFFSINLPDSCDCNGRSLKDNDMRVTVELTSPPNNLFKDCKFRVSLRLQIVREVKFFFEGNPKDKDSQKKIRWEIE
jgi:hypothetical protein